MGSESNGEVAELSYNQLVFAQVHLTESFGEFCVEFVIHLSRQPVIKLERVCHWS